MTSNRVYTKHVNEDGQTVFTYYRGWKMLKGYKSFSTLEDALHHHETVEALDRIDLQETTIVWLREGVTQ